jgi:hypothetical protein
MLLDLSLAALELSQEQTKRIRCPKCKGPDKTLAVTKKLGFLLFNCYRASCSAKGRIDIGCQGPAVAPKSKAKPLPYTPPLYPLTTKQLEHLQASYGLLANELVGARYNPRRGSVVYPIRDNTGVQIGVVDRSYNNTKPKALTHFFDTDQRCTAALHFPQPVYDTDSLCIVEDITSAIRLSRFRPTAALLGSHLSIANAAYLSTLTPELVFVLDPDARDKAIKLASSFRDMFVTKVLFLPKDPKDLTHEELARAL